MSEKVHVIGIDPSLSSTGIAYPRGNFTTIKTEKLDEDYGRRLSQIDQRFRQILAWCGPDVAVIEGYGGGPRQKSANQVVELGGVLRLALFDYNVPFVEVPPLSIKKYATDNGFAQKHEMKRAAQAERAYPANDDEADAFWLRHVGETFYNMDPLKWQYLEPQRLALVERMKWPKI